LLAGIAGRAPHPTGGRAAGVSFFQEEIILLRIRLLAGLLVLGLTAGCKAQTSPPSGSDPSLDASLSRRIEVQIRSEFELPPDVNMHIGGRKPSQFAGYQTLPVILSHGAKTQEIDFLISDDNARLVHMDTMDLTKNPADSINTAGRPIRGNPAAKVTVVNFDDLECPFCARMHRELFPATMAHYGDKVRFIYKDDPLTDMHPWAMHASVDANCLAAQSGPVYWNYVDYLHTHVDEITADGKDLHKSFDSLDRIARQEGTLGKLNDDQLNACIAKQDEAQVRASAKEADALGIDGTPAVFVDGERVNGGAVPQDELWEAIDRALLAQGEQPPAPPAPTPQEPAAKNAPAPAAGSK
jgi:protein-disulfide isomerase